MNLTDPRFQDPEKARQWLEAQRWPDGPVCSHCGSMAVTPIKRKAGSSTRLGVYQCNDCRGQFTVTTGSVMERSKIPLNKWLLAMHLMASSKKGISAHQLHRTLGITYQSAWFLTHRIREAMRDDSPSGMGGSGKIVEADETYFGDKDRVTKRTKRGKASLSNKRSIVALVERGGRARTFHVDQANKKSVREILVRNVYRETVLFTDESSLYTKTGREFAAHETVTHSAGEYARGDIHTNTVEGYFSIFKRGMKGIYQHCAEAHLHRYLAEFDFRYNNRSALGVEDTERTTKLIQQTGGKRLTYRRIGQAANA